MTPPRNRSPRDDRGHASAFVICTALTLVACLGLVWDGGAMLTRLGRVSTLADEAARTGAQQLDLTVLRSSGERRLDPAAARRAATAYLTDAGATGTVTVDRDTVTVTARLDAASRLLELGPRTAEATSTAAARPPDP